MLSFAAFVAGMDEGSLGNLAGCAHVSLPSVGLNAGGTLACGALAEQFEQHLQGSFPKPFLPQFQ